MDTSLKIFAGRLRHSDGTYGLSNTMSLDDLLKSLLEFLPMDIIYTVQSGDDAIMKVEPIGRIGLRFKTDQIQKEEFHGEGNGRLREEGEQLRTQSDGLGEEDLDGRGRPGLDEESRHGKGRKRVHRQREESSDEHDSSIEEGKNDGRNLEPVQTPLFSEQAALAVKSDQKKRGRPMGSKNNPKEDAVASKKNEKKVEKKVDKFKSQFMFFNPATKVS